ncbi:MAG: hypothetical protein IT445_12970 [Phycisphaeraceae bacterium]|nr:hypothetical protein [Phycisphaeraceae bacterium]
MKRAKRLLTWVVVLCPLIGWSAQAFAGDAAVQVRPQKHLVGVLQSGFSAIGGETTGWMLVRARARAVEVDISACSARAQAVEGLRVIVSGYWETRCYVERGPVRVFVAKRIKLIRHATGHDPRASASTPRIAILTA